MPAEFSFEVESRLNAPAARVWSAAATMAGVNYELAPLVRMTAPAQFRAAPIDEWEARPALFRSWILLGCWLPWDLHSFGMEALEPGRAFREKSSSWQQREWRHDRSVEPLEADSCLVRDRVRFRPRFGPAGRLALPIFRAIFRHRHRRLLRRFGRAPAPQL